MLATAPPYPTPGGQQWGERCRSYRATSSGPSLKTAAGGQPTAFAIQVLDVIDGHITAIHSFIDPRLFEVFGLPRRPDF